MKNREPKYPGRVKLIPVAGEPNVYDMVRADEPIQKGDPLNAATLLSDSTAAMFGLDDSATPNSVFALLANHLAVSAKVASGTYTGTGTIGKSQAPNILNFGFTPDLVIVQSVGDAWRGPVIFLRGCARAIFRNAIEGVVGSTELAVSWNDTGLEWYIDECWYWQTYGDASSKNWDTPPDPGHQLNASGIPYRWIAFGRGKGAGINISDDENGNVFITTIASSGISDDGNGNVVVIA